MAKLTGETMAAFLHEQAAKRQALLAQADMLVKEAGQIEQEVFRPLAQDPATFLSNGRKTPKVVKGGPRAKKGEQQGDLLAALANQGGKLTTKEATDLFTQKGYRTSANAVLMRMAKKGLVINSARGEWTRKVKPTGKAKLTPK